MFLSQLSPQRLLRSLTGPKAIQGIEIIGMDLEVHLNLTLYPSTCFCQGAQTEKQYNYVQKEVQLPNIRHLFCARHFTEDLIHIAFYNRHRSPERQMVCLRCPDKGTQGSGMFSDTFASPGLVPGP